MEVKDLHSAGIELFQSLIPKSCKFKYPSSTIDNRYKNKTFTIDTISAGKLSEKMMKRYDYSFSEEYIRITIRYVVLQETVSNSLNIKLNEFKNDNVTVIFKKKSYTIVEENECEFESAIELICKRTT